MQFSVVYAVRNGGYKFSVRNETAVYHAGTITQKALDGLGGGGGHFSMAGGVITEDRMSQLQPDPDFEIRRRFLNVIKQERLEMEKKKS